jgi:hypothetical protein
MAKHTRKEYIDTSDKEPFLLDVTDKETGKTKEIEFLDPNRWGIEDLYKWTVGDVDGDYWFFHRKGWGDNFDLFRAEWKDAPAVELGKLTTAIKDYFLDKEE